MALELFSSSLSTPGPAFRDGRTHRLCGSPTCSTPAGVCRPPTDKILTSLTNSVPADNQRSIYHPHIGFLPNFWRSEMSDCVLQFFCHCLMKSCFLHSFRWLICKLIKIKSKACFALSNEFQEMENLIYWSTISKHIFIYVADLSRAIHSIQMQKKGTEMGSTRKRKKSWCWAKK
jgi:hypothetical protein